MSQQGTKRVENVFRGMLHTKKKGKSNKYHAPKALRKVKRQMASASRKRNRK